MASPILAELPWPERPQALAIGCSGCPPCPCRRSRDLLRWRCSPVPAGDHAHWRWRARPLPGPPRWRRRAAGPGGRRRSRLVALPALPIPAGGHAVGCAGAALLSRLGITLTLALVGTTLFLAHLDGIAELPDREAAGARDWLLWLLSLSLPEITRLVAL